MLSKGKYHKLYCTARWLKLRKGVLTRYPLCKFCDAIGIIEAANVVDHIKPHRGDEQLFFDRENLQSLCEQCHNSHAARKDAGHMIAGCDVYGHPLDKKHPWN